jgi:DNA-binding NarL/FixJ family response regulator
VGEVTDQDLNSRVEPGSLIRVVVVDDHELVRSGICNALSLASDLEVVGEAADGLEALDLLAREPVDILLLDLHMPRMDGFACLDAVAKRWPHVSVIVLTVDEDREVALEAMRRGAAAFVPKFVKPGDLASLVRQVMSGAVIMGGSRPAEVFANGHAEMRTGPSSSHGLTKREMEVLELVAEGMTNSDIAHRLFITVKTVKYHLTCIFSKLGLHNRTEAAAFAITQGLVPSLPSAPKRPPGT